MAKKEAEQALLEEIAASDDPINATLYEQYSRNLRKAVDGVFAEDNSGGLSDRLRANVSRFAAYKAYHATGEIRKEIGKNGNIDAGRKELHAFNRYQAAEYNTTVSRCRTAKQFQEFSQPDNVRLFPNIKWLPSRSATPREQHILFYNRVWAKNDSFWNANQPGNLWNCKCDWEETDEPVTDNNPTTPIRHDGLEKNPAITGEVFTDNASYIRHCKDKAKAEKFVDKYLHWHNDFMRYKQDPDYKDVEFDYETGGMMAVHKEHILHEAKKEKRFFGDKTSGYLELSCGRQLKAAGHRVVFVNEIKPDSTGNNLPVLDIELNGTPMDIKSVTEDSLLGGALLNKNRQIKNVKIKTGVESDSVVLFFYKPEYFTEDKMQNGILYYKNFRKKDGTPITQRIHHIYIVRKGIKEILEYDI